MKSITQVLDYTPFIKTLHPSLCGKVDIVGDVHGCFDELSDLLDMMGWVMGEAPDDTADPITLNHPDGRHLVFVGDLTDRGPASDKVLRLFVGAQQNNTATCVMGNHDWKLARYLVGRPVSVRESSQGAIDQIEALGSKFITRVLSAYKRAPHQLILPLPPLHPYADAGSLIVAHGAARTHRQGREDRDTFERSIYGYPTGEVDDSGNLVREDWAQSYDGLRPVVHGHTPCKEPRIVNRVICVDTGCVFGNALTAYRVDSDSFVQVPALTNHSSNDKYLIA